MSFKEIKKEEIGLKAGLEIHQQLNTKKLFCNCPSILRTDEPEFKVERILNPVVGETGEIDIAAAYEKEKDKKYIYEVYNTNCLVELDEEPPHEINKEALRIALQIAILLNCKIFPVSQIMRKMVIDGSNTSGFQRTVLIGYDGYIQTSEGQVGIETIALEEDSARRKDSTENLITFALDRLGIPLVEITTKPDLKSKEQIKEAALKIGEILRSCNVKRGIGTIRQDLNLSYSGTNRVEIKGFQDIKMMFITIENEINRQKKLQDLKSNFQKIKLSKKEEISKILKNTKCKFIKTTLEKGEIVLGLKLENAKNLLGIEIQPGKRVGTDLSDLAKSKSRIGGIIHSDEKLEKYELSEEEITKIKEILEIKEKDAFILIATSKEKTDLAAKAIENRLIQLRNGNPSEVRNANPDGTTSFLRPMPGAARMYPETDTPLLKIQKKLILEIKKNLPKLPSQNKRYLQNFGLNDELIVLILKQGKVEEFVTLVETIDNPKLIGKMITVFLKEIASKEKVSQEKVEKILHQERLIEILKQVNKKISENDVKTVMQRVYYGMSIEKAIEKADINIEEELQNLLKEKPGLSEKAYMGLVMTKFKGQISGKELMDTLKRIKIQI